MLAFTCLVFLDLKKGCIEWVLLVVDISGGQLDFFAERGARSGGSIED
jgi:hypothetical protein